jgi:peroxiredoxin
MNRSRFPFAQLALVAVLLLAGVGLIGVAAYRTVWPSKPPAPPIDLAAEAEADLEKRGYKPLSGPLKELIEDKKYKGVATQVHPLLGKTAPNLDLVDVDGKRQQVGGGEMKGPVVLVFYYGYHCNHCVSQLFGLNKDLEKFRELGARVIAVSADPPALTRQRYERYGAFDFPVLSDPGNKVAALYGAWRPTKDGEGDLAHATFVIGRDGKVRWANMGDEPFTENRTLLVEVARAEGRLPK